MFSTGIGLRWVISISFTSLFASFIMAFFFTVISVLWLAVIFRINVLLSGFIKRISISVAFSDSAIFVVFGISVLKLRIVSFSLRRFIMFLLIGSFFSGVSFTSIALLRG